MNESDIESGLEIGTPTIELPTLKPLTPTERRLIQANTLIYQQPPEYSDYLHSVMCQVGMPRRATVSRTFERTSGNMSISLEAGRSWNGKEWRDQPLPYGRTPRLVMVHLSSEAIRTQNPTVEIGSSIRKFLHTLGIGDGGGPRGGYTTFRKQMEALAVCKLTIGMQDEGRVVMVNTNPIHKFEAWLRQSDSQPTLWPGRIELSHEFFETLQAHSVPLDYRALSALKHSAFALDIYTWLAHRLCRIRSPQGVMLSWENLREQFGQEYGNPKDFKKEFRVALKQVMTVYPNARIQSIIGGIKLLESPPPISKTQISLAGLPKFMDN